MFTILYDEIELGRSAFEEGDPPMGCAEGKFFPHHGFPQFRSKVDPQPDGDPKIRRWVGLSVRTENNTPVECLDAVLFEYDFGGRSELWVDVIGIPYPDYEELFPNRYSAHETSLPKDNI